MVSTGFRFSTVRRRTGNIYRHFLDGNELLRVAFENTLSFSITWKVFYSSTKSI